VGLTRTKIVATVGPASGSPEMIERLIRAGADVFRLNFSHGNHASHAGYIERIRRAAKDAGQPVAIMQDLQGPRIRTGALRGHAAVKLEPGAEVLLVPGEFEGDARRIAVNYEGLAADVRPGDSVLLSDGLIELKVLDTDGRRARCTVAVGGLLGEHKGINLPGVALSISAPTRKDVDDLRFGIQHGVDWVALSFVRSADDIRRLRRAIRELAGPQVDLPVMAKIEKPEAVQNLRDILQAADGVMVARGDLGIEMPTEEVPHIQKQIIRMANRFAVPAVTATQMLESMIAAPRPTRAEASDVANAILDGTDAVMLSAETSVGKYPVEAVRMMDRIAQCTQQLGGTEPPPMEGVGNPRQHALAGAACNIARELGAACIVPFTITGSTARYISQRRPCVPIYALTPREETCRRLALLWGVRGVRLGMFESGDQMIEQGRRRLLELGLVAPGQTVVYVAGPSGRTAGATDMLKVERL